MVNLLLFGVPYLVLAIVFSVVVRGLEVGEMCSLYALVPLIGVMVADYALEKFNSYIANRLQPLKERIPLPRYMALLNAMMYISVYTAGAFWAYRLTGKYLFVPALFLIGLVSGGMVVRKFWME